MGERIEGIISAVGQTILLSLAAGMVGLLVYSVGYLPKLAKDSAEVSYRDVNRDGIQDIVIHEIVSDPAVPMKQFNVREKVFYGADIEGKRVYLAERP